MIPHECNLKPCLQLINVRINVIYFSLFSYSHRATPIRQIRQNQMDEKRRRALLKKQRYDQLLNGFPMKISRSKTKGRHILASRDLSAGSVVLKELPVGFSLFKDAMDEYCHLCLKELPETSISNSDDTSSFMGPQRSKRGIPCSHCRKQTFYCSQDCHDQDSKRHAIECEMIILLPGIAGAHSVDYGLLRLIVRYLSNRIFKASSSVSSHDTYLPSLEAFECTKDLVGHKSSASPAWLKCVEEAGILPLYYQKELVNLMNNSTGHV
jgi:hypothetical protein